MHCEGNRDALLKVIEMQHCEGNRDALLKVIEM